MAIARKDYSSGKVTEHSLCVNMRKISEIVFNDFFSHVDTVLVDCDGVLWKMDKPVSGSSEVIACLQNLGKKIFLVTNNSTLPRNAIFEKAKSMKINVPENQILNAAYLTANFLNDMNFSKLAYVIGGNGVGDELEQVDIECIGIGPDNFTSPEFKNVNLQSDIGAVIVGHDIYISYNKLLKAMTYLSDKRCLFIATCTETRIPTSGKLLLPGAGSIVAAISSASKRSPIILGKPQEYMHKFLVNNFNINPIRTLIIGDSCEIDMAFGNKCGYHTLLVLTGESNLAEAKNYARSNPSLAPEYYVKEFSDLLKFLPKTI